MALSAKALDAALHEQRWDAPRGEHRLHEDAWPGLPDGTFALFNGAPVLVREDRLTPWLDNNRYGAPVSRPTVGTAMVITPPLTVEVLRAGYPVHVGA